MARGAESTSSAKRAKVDKEDPLVRRRNELILEVANARAEGMRLVREAEEKAQRLKREAEESLAQHMPSVCTELEAANRKLLGKLPPELWSKIVDENLDQNDLLALAMTCRFFREKQKVLGKKLETNLGVDHFLKLLKTGNVPSHSLDWFQWVCDTFEILPGFEWDERVEGAAYEGDLVDYAAFKGSVEILRWLMEEKEWKPYHYFWAGAGGSVKVLEYLKLKGYKFDESACQGAAEGGHLNVLKFLRGLDPPCPWDKWTCTSAAGEGHLEIVKWLKKQTPPCPWSEKTCAWAAKGERLEVLKWLRAQDPPCPWDAETCAEAARWGRLEVLKWARDQDPPCPWDERICTKAAEGGHLEVLKWLRAQDPPCPWDWGTCAAAAEGGHLDVLKWLRSQDPPCPWDERTCAAAAKGGHLDVLKWARAQDPPCSWRRSACRESASQNDHQHIVKWIDQQEDESDAEYREYSDSDSDEYF
ncbi:putative ankyrin repeat protein [Chloropicon roscoffensis]|uniref:Ankyrin repeat protein n=1 Tax=Chloropicon roscoffensis TaxID=1461544 RepID=A0AAX4PMX5_9CHLO